MDIIVTRSQLHTVAKNVIKKIHTTKNKSATVVALSGDLGSGKTTLTQEICKLLSVTEHVISPTFVIMKYYEIEDILFRYLIHIDAYRLNNGHELWKLGFQNLLDNPENLILVEWPEKVPECIPGNALLIELTHQDIDTRKIKMKD